MDTRDAWFHTKFFTWRFGIAGVSGHHLSTHIFLDTPPLTFDSFHCGICIFSMRHILFAVAYWRAYRIGISFELFSALMHTRSFRAGMDRYFLDRESLRNSFWATASNTHTTTIAYEKITITTSFPLTRALSSALTRLSTSRSQNKMYILYFCTLTFHRTDHNSIRFIVQPFLLPHLNFPC